MWGAVLAGASPSSRVSGVLCVSFSCVTRVCLRASWLESVVAGSLSYAEVMELNETSVDEERLYSG